MKLNIKLIYLIIGLALIAPCMATDIDIYYPIDNITTEIQYAESGNYTIITNNSIFGNFSAIIINDELQYDSVIESPHKIITPLFGLVLIIILFTFIIVMIKLIKRIWK